MSRRTMAAVLLLGLCWTGASAQEALTCSDDDPDVFTCFNRILSEGAAALEDETGESAQETVARLVDEQGARENAVRTNLTNKATSDDSATAPSARRNFLPVFLGTLGLGDVKDDGDTVTVTFNPNLLGISGSRLVGQLEFREPELYRPLTEVIPAGDRDTFEDALDDFDDVRIELAWTLETRTWGRNFEKHQDLFGRVYDALVTPQRDARQELVDLLSQSGTFGLFEDMDNQEMVAALKERAASAAQETLEEMRLRAEVARETGFLDLDDLVNNQPQIFATAAYRERDELTGPDEFSVKFTWEKGFANINGLRRFCSEKVTPACLAAYLKKHSLNKDMAPRIALSAEYAEIDPYRFDEPTVTMPLDIDRVERTTASFTYGSYVHAIREDAQPTHFDLELSYQDHSDDETLNNRFVATASFTRKLSDGSSAILGVVYSNRPEYRGEVDEELSARLGINFKVDRKEQGK
jgi:hypothetical protein